MHVYVNGSWIGGFLDATPSPERPLVAIRRQVALSQVTGQFFVRDRDLAMLISYVRMIGARQVLRKVRSRQSEALRNDAWLSVGIGGIHGDPTSRAFAFVLPSGPEALERAVIHQDLLWELPGDVLDSLPTGHFVPLGVAGPSESLTSGALAELHELEGWSSEEGTLPTVSRSTWQTIAELAVKPGHSFTETAPRPAASEPCHRVDLPRGKRGSTCEPPSYHCFGYGQYAKTQIIPNLGSRLRLAGVHEIDPFQIGRVDPDVKHGWDTLGHPREGEFIENAVVASFHQTHAPTAVELLNAGTRHIIIEKPLATTSTQLDRLLTTLAGHPDARIHAAFQRRYSPFNDHLLRDLEGPPISMAATVYEVPLPVRHWYRWPAAGNAIVSNACHWIDYFLFFNDYAEVRAAHVEQLTTQIVMSLELENGASSVVSLRHTGAPRRGVRDNCVFWSDCASATIEDNRHYTAERAYRKLRGLRAHPYQAHNSMYREFARRIEEDAPGDSSHSIEVSARTVLHLAHLLDARIDEGS